MTALGRTASAILLTMCVVTGAWASSPPDPEPALVPTTVEPPLLRSGSASGCELPPGPHALTPPVVPPPVLPPCPLDPPTPIVTLKVRVPAGALPGQELEYRLCIENCSPAAAHHVIIRNPLPANARFVRANPEPTQVTPELQWKLGTMHGGERRQIVLILQPTDAADVTSCARVQFEHGQCVTTRVAAAPPPGMIPGIQPGKQPPIVPVPKEGQLKLTMTGPKEQYANLPATYFLTVTNTGKSAATNLLMSAQLPAALKFVSAGTGGKEVENQVAWIVGDLAAGATKTVELVVRARQAGRFCIRGRVLADGGLTDEAEFCTTFQGSSALGLELTDRRDPLQVGGEASYLIEVVNQGTAPATNVQVRALVPELLTYLRAGGANVRIGERTPDGFQTLLFEPVKILAPGTRLEIEVFARALRPGDARFKVILTADQLERGPVLEEESTTIFADEPRPE